MTISIFQFKFEFKFLFFQPISVRYVWPGEWVYEDGDDGGGREWAAKEDAGNGVDLGEESD